MEVRTDAEIARDRMLGVMLTSTDEKTRRACWRAALRYAGRMRVEAQTGNHASTLARTHKVGLKGRAIVK